MASQNPPRSSDDMILFALERALREVWAVLKAHDPHGYLDKDDGLQKAIADLHDPAQVTRHAVRCLPNGSEEHAELRCLETFRDVGKAGSLL